MGVWSRVRRPESGKLGRVSDTEEAGLEGLGFK